MIQAPELPLWAAIVISLLILSGSLFTLIGVIGLTRLKTFYERVHAPTLGATLGGVLICSGSMLCFALLQTRFIAHEILLVGFVLITTPVTLILLVRAALYRDRAEENPSVPPME